MPMRRRKGESGSAQHSDNLLTTAQVYEKLGISKSKFYEMIKIIPLKATLEHPKRYAPYDVTVWVQKWNNHRPKLIKSDDKEEK